MGWAREVSQASLPWQRHCSRLSPSIWTEASYGFLGDRAHTHAEQDLGGGSFRAW